MNSITEVSKEVTIIMISHDPSLMTGFDKIIEIRDAELRVIEERS
jgi:ABC-type lipoprotein export system ATPase subunit